MKILLTFTVFCVFAFGQPNAAADKEAAMKADLAGQIDGMKKQAQVMVDSVFSFGELGFQEFETSKYLSGILEKEGFKIERGVAGIPTAFVASWGSGKPVISLGSDIDDIPQASQKPGVAYHAPMIDGAPGHGEGHNSGMPLNIIAALAVKKVMEREHLKGTIRLWPGVAEEDLGGKAYYVRAGVFKDVDVVLFTHVGAGFNVSSGPTTQSGLVSVEYQFKGESAHAAAAPWRGRSALDAVELMDVGWNFRREHLRLATRIHYVITNGGDQPNVVPPNASVWYYYRETDYDHIMNLWNIGDKMAQAATLMTDTTFTSRVLGVAWPGHFNVPIADDMYQNVVKVGMPQWSDADQALAKALQKDLKQPERGLSTNIPRPRAPRPAAAANAEGFGENGGGAQPTGGGSDDIGDVSWVVPTVTLNYPSNIPGGPGHNWANGVSMATPIAHKGVVAGAKVQAMTMLDILLHPELVQKAWDYYNNVQTKDVKYKSLLRPEDVPAIWLNKKTMEEYRPRMKELYTILRNTTLIWNNWALSTLRFSKALCSNAPGVMRVIAGEFRSRRLNSVEGLQTRPTSDRLRETLFNILGARVEGCVFVDVYAGTGAVGIEALSRGARQAVFIEKDRKAVATIRENLELLKIGGRARVIQGLAHLHLGELRLGGVDEGDIVFLDPPYEKQREYSACLEVLQANPPALAVVQHSVRLALEKEYGPLHCTRVLKQGDNALSFYKGPD